MIDHFGPGVGHLNYLVVPGVGIFEFFTTNHFLGWGISVIFDLTFLPGVGNLIAILGKMSKSCPMPRLPPHPPCRLDIDRCLMCFKPVLIMHQSIPAVPITPPPPGKRGAFAHVVSPGGRAFAILSRPRGLGISVPQDEPRAFDTSVKAKTSREKT